MLQCSILRLPVLLRSIILRGIKAGQPGNSRNYSGILPAFGPGWGLSGTLAVPLRDSAAGRWVGCCDAATSSGRWPVRCCSTTPRPARRAQGRRKRAP